MRLIDADRLLSDKMKQKYYHLPNGDVAIPIIDIEHAPTVNVLAPRILDPDELQTHPHVWYEVSNDTKPIPGLVIPSRTVTRRRIVAYQPVFDAVVYLPENDYYKRTWRCWSAEPTEEQRKAVKWDATKG